MKLTDMECIPCRGDQPKLTQEEIDHYLPQVAGWQVSTQNDIPRLTRQFKFKNFVQALAFANRVGDLAEQQDHHPAILVEWGRVTVSWWTHVIGGLHQNDFISAAKTDQLYHR
jgi:4a-hydroxytetrahydrobiopterin dehydratase